MISKNEDIRIVKTKKAIKSAFAELLEEVAYSKISIIDISQLVLLANSVRIALLASLEKKRR